MRQPVKQLRQFDRVEPTPLWSAIEARHPGPELPPPVSRIRRALVIVTALAVFAVAGAFAWQAFQPGASSTGPTSPGDGLQSYVNPMGIQLALDYPPSWFAQSVSQDSNLDPSKTGPLQVGVVVSNAVEAMPSGSVTIASPGPLPENPDLPMDFVTVTILAKDDAIGSSAEDSPLPLSMENAKPAPGPGNVRFLEAVIAGTPIEITVSAGPNYSRADLVAADAIVASIRPSNGSEQSDTPSPSNGSTNPLDRPDLNHVNVVPQRVVSSSPDLLIVEAPIGEVRWKQNKDCGVTGAPVGGTNAGGFGGGGCDGGALSANLGGLSVGGTFYDVIRGQAYFGQEVTVRATFVDGTTSDVMTHNGMWMIVFQPKPELYSPASKVATVEAISSTGQVLGQMKVP
jgi:hypothetical protein